MSRPVIAPSARKHGIADEDILHAYRNPIRRFDLDEGMTMIGGASRADGLLEVGVVAGDEMQGPVPDRRRSTIMTMPAKTQSHREPEVGDHHAA